MEVQLPLPQHEAFAAFVSLKAEALEKLRKILAGIPPTFALDEVARRHAAELDLDWQSFHRIMLMMMSMAASCDRKGWDARDFVESLFKAANPGTNKASMRLAKEVLVQAISADSPFWLISKSGGLTAETERRWDTARLITDARLVFSSESDPTPKAAVILHQLRLTYASNEGEKEFYVTMDSTDFDRLEKEIARARKKEAALRELLRDKVQDISNEL